jgi:hypothetical protein
MIKTVYAAYGVLAHEKRPVFSVHAPASDIYDEVKIVIPDELIVGENNIGEPILNLDGVEYLLSEALSNRGDMPVLRWYANGQHKHINLK